MVRDSWTETENDLIVADYFAMLAEDLAGRPYSKAGHNRRLQNRVGRGRGSIEYKHQNISAVLQWLGQTWIPGYKPALNFQGELIDAVVRWLDRRPDYLAPARLSSPETGLQAAAELFVGPPPTVSNQLPPKELDHMLAVARKFDAAGRDERNRALGRAGEERALAHEKSTLTWAGPFGSGGSRKVGVRGRGGRRRVRRRELFAGGPNPNDRGKDDERLGSHAVPYHAERTCRR